MKPQLISRAEPLTPSAVLATGAAAKRLAHALLKRDDETLLKLRALVGDQLVIAAGDAALLPWVDGAQYLAAEPEAPQLFLPTTLSLSIHPLLVERALKKLVPDGPLALTADRSVVSLASLGPISRARLSAWIAPEGQP